MENTNIVHIIYLMIGWDDFVELVQTRLDMIQDQPADPETPEEGESIRWWNWSTSLS